MQYRIYSGVYSKQTRELEAVEAAAAVVSRSAKSVSFSALSRLVQGGTSASEAAAPESRSASFSSQPL